MVSWDPLHVWTKELTKTFPDLSRPQLKGLAEWSFGMVLSRCCSLDSVAFYLADWFDQSEFTVRSRLREWYLPAQYKSVSPSGDKRQELPVASCFAPLLNWVRRGWPQPRLALALDASTLANRFVLLAVSVLYRRCAVPVAWKVLPATAKGSWRPYWVQLLQAVRGVLPDNWTVLVLADRGLWARWLFNEVQLLGWHPLMRVNRGGCFRPEGSRKFVRFTKLVSKVGKSWKGHGTAFATPGHQIEST